LLPELFSGWDGGGLLNVEFATLFGKTFLTTGDTGETQREIGGL
jgi:hypothetical protein